MTLLELFAAVLILSMTALIMGNGIGIMQKVCQKTEKEIQAQNVLFITAELLSDEFACAFAEKKGEDGRQWLFSQKSECWISLKADPEHGISRIYETDSGAEQMTPLLSTEAMGELFYTDFESCFYEDACFTITELAVYEKCDAKKEDAIPFVRLPELTVHAVNLETERTEPPASENGKDKGNGFTLIELLSVLAMLLLLSCLLLPAVFRIEQHVRRLQMEQTAKELFLTAQKQLTLEEARGSLERIFSIENGREDRLREKIGISSEDLRESESSEPDSVFVLYQPDSMDNPTEEIRERLLPKGSLAETIRSDGSYLIEYDPHTAQICAVWYSKDYCFTEEDIGKSDFNKESQRIIGYYGSRKK